MYGNPFGRSENGGRETALQMLRPLGREGAGTHASRRTGVRLSEGPVLPEPRDHPVPGSGRCGGVSCHRVPLVPVRPHGQVKAVVCRGVDLHLKGSAARITLTFDTVERWRPVVVFTDEYQYRGVPLFPKLVAAPRVIGNGGPKAVADGDGPAPRQAKHDPAERSPWLVKRFDAQAGGWVRNHRPTSPPAQLRDAAVDATMGSRPPHFIETRVSP